MAAGSTYTPIATQTLSVATGIVTFSSIPQIYTDLIFVVSAKVTAATYDISALRVNSVTSSYSRSYLQGDGSSALTGRATAEISLRGGYLPGTNFASQFSADFYHFMKYTDTNINRIVLSRTNSMDTSGTGFNVMEQVALIPTTSAITQITLQTANGSNLNAGSTFTLYGLAAA